MNKKLKITLYFLLFFLGFLGIQDLCRKKTQGFTLSKARSSYDAKEDLTLAPEDLKSVQSILNQPFHFITRGLQCYVFASQDDKYVLKLLKWKEIEPPFWAKYLPSSSMARIRSQKEKKKEHDFTSYQIAFEELKEETGLLYLHLKKTEGLNTTLCLYDPIQIQHLIPADHIEFILQKKAMPFLEYFEKHKNNEEKMREFLSHFVAILQTRIGKKISDSDISLEYNMGIFEGKPLLFDVGNLSRMKEVPSSSHEILEQESRLVLAWLKLHSPNLASFLEDQILETSL